MNQPPSTFRLGVPAQNNPFAKAVKATTPSLAMPAVQPSHNNNRKGYNPFMTAMNTDSKEFKDNYGVNRPLKEAMFLGYHNDQPIFAGNRLFILY